MLKDRVTVITGGTGILGRYMVKALVEEGSNVVILGRNEQKGKEICSTLDKEGKKVKFFKCDVLKKEEILNAKNFVMSTFGTIDILINAAGGNNPQATVSEEKTFFKLEKDALQNVIELNILGTLLPCQVFGEIMAEKKEGNIINISSMTAFRPLTRVVGYSIAKAGINNFTQWLAVYMAQEFSANIRVNAIAPGFFLTEQNRYLLIDKDTGKYTQRAEKILAHTPQKRFGEPDELISTLLWLLSPASKFITGIVVPVDGGFSAYSGV